MIGGLWDEAAFSDSPGDMGGFRKVGLITCTALALANMIGTGVFTSLGFQCAAIPSPFLILLVWALGGVVALCGALSYAELAAALPRSGANANFLSAIYHPAIGFMGGFVSVTVGFSAPIALSAMALGKYMTAALPGIPAALVSVVAVVLLCGGAFADRASEREFSGCDHVVEGRADYRFHRPWISAWRSIAICSS